MSAVAFASLSAARDEGWTTLLIYCEGCRVIRQMEASTFPAETLARPVNRFVAALRCSTCGRRPAEVRIQRRLPSASGYGAPRFETMAIG